MDVAHPPADLGDHLRTVRRRWWLAAGVTVLGALLAAAVAAAQPRSYTSTASVLVLPTGTQDANNANGRTKNAINLDTEAQLVRSSAVSTVAAGSLHTHDRQALLDSLTVSVPPNSTVLRIGFTAHSPGTARAGAHAFATAYLTNRRQASRAAERRATRALDTQIKHVTRDLQDTADRLGRTAPDSAQYAFLSAQQRNLTHQLDGLTERRNDAAAGHTGGGRIISDAALPRAATGPALPLYVAGGALLGLLAGLAAALLAGRFDRRIRYPEDLTRYVGVPVLGRVPEAPDRLLAAGSPGGRVFGLLRNELLAAGRPARVVAVVGTADGPAGTVVAAHLAAAFAHGGGDSTLAAAAGTPGRCPVDAARLTGVPARPGWREALADETTVDDAAHPAADEPGLRVLAGPAAGQIRPEAARAVLAELRATADHVVLATPDAERGADAQTLASLADVALLAVELGVSRRRQVADAAEQLRRVGTPLLGAVLLGRYRSRPGRMRTPARPRPAAGETTASKTTATETIRDATPDEQAHGDRTPAEAPTDVEAAPAGTGRS